MSIKTINYRNPQLTGTRVMGNPNLTTFADMHYQGLEVMPGVGPFCYEHLSKLYQTIMRSVGHHPRTFALRFDLRLPKGMALADENRSNEIVRSFFASLKAKVDHDRDRAKKYNHKAHDSRLGYVWCRESTGGKPHWHCLILLNWDAYRSLGSINSEFENMHSRIQAAWASALGLQWDDSHGLAHFPENACYRLNANPGSGHRHGEIEGLDELFHRTSYLCKLNTKVYGQKNHSFGCSRR